MHLFGVLEKDLLTGIYRDDILYMVLIFALRSPQSLGFYFRDLLK